MENKYNYVLQPLKTKITFIALIKNPFKSKTLAYVASLSTNYRIQISLISHHKYGEKYHF
jgi:hypothetical protein